MKKAVKILSVLVVLMFLVSCATWQKTATISYDVGCGAALTSAFTSEHSLRAAGKITDAQHAQFKDAYTKAYYGCQAVGNAIVLAIGESDLIKQKDYLAAYNVALTNFVPLYNAVSKFLTEVQK